MRRQFVRVYMGIAAVLLLSALAAIFVLGRVRDASLDRWIEDTTAPVVTRIREEVARAAGDPDELARVLETLSETYWRSVRVEPIADLPLSSSARAQVAAGGTVLVRSGKERCIYAAVGGGNAVIVDAFPRRSSADRRRARSKGSPGGPPPRPPGVSWLDWSRRHPGIPPGRPPGPPLGRLPWGPSRYTIPPQYWPISLLLAILLLIGAAIYFLIRPLERRIYGLSAAAEHFGSGNLQTRAEAEGNDAIAELARTFNSMAGRIEGLIGRQKELLHAVSHELRTPLARLYFLLDNAQAAPTPKERNQHLSRIERTLTDMNDLVEELLTFVRLDGDTAEPAPERIDVPSALRRIAEQATTLRNDVTVEVDCPQMVISAIPRYFKRAVLNLVTNAVAHAAERVQITCRCEAETLCLSVDDDGPGIPEEAREKVFEPFFRVDESRSSGGGGAGLGLAIVQRIMASLDGSVRVTEGPLGGARFTLAFPGGGQMSDSEKSPA